MTKDNDDNYEDVSIYDIDIAACDLMANAHYKQFVYKFNATLARVFKLEKEMSSMNKLNSELISKHNTMNEQLLVAGTEISNIL